MLSSLNVCSSGYSNFVKSSSVSQNYIPGKFQKLDLKQRQLVPYASSPISFGYNFSFKTLKGLPCPCCGRIMSTNEEINKFVEVMSTAKGKQIIEKIEEFIDRLPDTERNVSLRIIERAKDNKDLGLKELMVAISKEPRQKLEKVQREILGKISNIAEGLTGNTYHVIQKDINAIDKIISEGRNGDPFKRKTIIVSMQNLADKETDIANKKILQDITLQAEEMPTSNTDINAFIVKYSQNKRSSSEIAHRLIEPSQSTAEHIHPHSKEGQNNPANYLAECKKCNNDRGNMSYVQWLKIHPEMIINVQKYINEIITRIIDGRIIGFDFYPRSVKKSLSEESGNLININITKYENWVKQKVSIWKANRSNDSATVGSNLKTTV